MNVFVLPVGMPTSVALECPLSTNQPPNIRFSACPNSAAFGGGCKYTLTSTVSNNCPGTYYEHAMANLWQKQDGSGETAGSNALLRAML